MAPIVHVTADPADLANLDALVLIGRAGRLAAGDVRAIAPDPVVPRMIDSGDPGDHGRVTSTWTTGQPAQLVVGVLPEVCSRHNSPSRAWAIPRMLGAAPRAGRVGVLLAIDDAAHAFAAVAAVARAFPTFSAGSGSRRELRVSVLALAPDGPVTDLAPLQATADAVRHAAHLVDMPPNQLTTDELVAEARRVAGQYDSVSAYVLRGDELAKAGLGGLWAVGKCAEHPPALVVLDHDPGPAADGGRPRKVAWVGKGIVYDTGGLSLKGKTSMPSMKNDMGGAASVLAAFRAAVELRTPARLTAVLCVAENAIGPGATRPDDVIRMYSGRTVEVNNTDAEGRLVLADGVAWVIRHREPDELVDIATLTGAQSMATGKRQAALFCNDDALELRAIAAGKHSGDLVHPLPYVPEFHRAEFGSPVADMRNSVKDRSNAQSSCAGQFIGNHLRGYRGPWLHVDMAGPVMSGGRATGYGPALLLSLLGVR